LKPSSFPVPDEFDRRTRKNRITELRILDL